MNEAIVFLTFVIVLANLILIWREVDRIKKHSAWSKTDTDLHHAWLTAYVNNDFQSASKLSDAIKENHLKRFGKIEVSKK